MRLLTGAVQVLTLLALATAAATVVAFLVALIVVLFTDGRAWDVMWFALAATAALAAPIVAYTVVLKRSDALYKRAIAGGLSRALASGDVEERTLSLDPDDMHFDNIIIFSDQHKGVRNPADDFWRAERAYCAALAHYLELGHRLVVLGDAEELWETWSPRKVISHHEGDGKSLALEAEFHARGRYDRVWGNHDLLWSSEKEVKKHLATPELFGDGFRVRRGLKLRVPDDGDRPGGLLFLVHGHQGTADSEAIAPISRIAVRLFGRLQRWFKRGWYTPANDWDLRDRHDTAMSEWAESKSSDGIVLIAGHTHRPVFWNSRPPIPGPDEIARRRAELDAARQAKRPPAELAEKHAALALEQAKENWGAGGAPPPVKMNKPSYFNSGCCSFADGDVTGLEILDGEIRLVRWLDNNGDPKPHYPEGTSKDLREVFAAVHGRSPAPRPVPTAP